MPTDDNSLLTTRRIHNNKDYKKARPTSNNNARSSVRRDISAEPSTNYENHDLFEPSTRACLAGDQTTVITHILFHILYSFHILLFIISDCKLNFTAHMK